MTFKFTSGVSWWGTAGFHCGKFFLCKRGLRRMFEIPRNVTKLTVVFSKKRLCKESAAIDTRGYNLVTINGYGVSTTSTVQDEVRWWVDRCGYKWVTIYY